MASERTPQQIIGNDAYAQLVFEGYVVTRPAPAATDTGLETVAKLGGINGVMLLRHIENLRPEAQAAYKDELVRRSQAEELLAAKDKTIALAETTMIEMHQDLNKLEADNAAKDARIKELEGINANLMGDDEDKPRYTTKRLKHEIARATEALEAKLAAAQEALEPFADHAKERAVDAQEWRDTDTVKIVVTIADLRAARAVLGGKPL